MAKARLWKVSVSAATDHTVTQSRLIKAPTAKQAVKRVIESQIEVIEATYDDVIALTKAGVEVENGQA